MNNNLNRTPRYYYELLESNPENYLTELKELFQEDPEQAYRTINDCSIHETWYSSAVFCLVYLTGTFRNDFLMDLPDQFYGRDTEIEEGLSLEIFNLLQQIGIDYTVQNYYGQTLIDVINTPSRYSRINNKNLLEKIQTCLE